MIPPWLRLGRAERWLESGKQQLVQRWDRLQIQIQPLDWPARCQRMSFIAEGEISHWQPRAGSSSAELALLVRSQPLAQRRYLASLLDAPMAGPNTLTEAVERLQLDLASKLDPLHSHREYATQLAILARRLELPAAAETAYLENEAKIIPAIDHLLFESLPSNLRSAMAGQKPPGNGVYLVWWNRQMLLNAQPAPNGGDWPAIPPAWLALGTLCMLRKGASSEPS